MLLSSSSNMRCLSHVLYIAVAMLCLIQFTLAAPIRRAELLRREIRIAMLDGSPVDSELVDLLDQWGIIEEALKKAEPGSERHAALLELKEQREFQLNQLAEGFAVFYSVSATPVSTGTVPGQSALPESPDDTAPIPGFTPALTADEPDPTDSVPTPTVLELPDATGIPEEDTGGDPEDDTPIIVATDEIPNAPTRTAQRVPTAIPNAPAGGNNGGGSGNGGGRGGVVDPASAGTSTRPNVPGASGFSESAQGGVVNTSGAVQSLPWTSFVTSACTLALWFIVF